MLQLSAVLDSPFVLLSLSIHCVKYCFTSTSDELQAAAAAALSRFCT